MSESSCYKYFLVSHDAAIYCMMDLVDPYGRYYRLPFKSRWYILDIILLGFFFIAGRFFINDVAQQCYITTLCLRSLLWKYHHIIIHLGLFLELSSLVLRNKSHPSFLVGDCTRSFLQVKCISCMVRNISQGMFIMKNSFALRYNHATILSNTTFIHIL